MVDEKLLKKILLTVEKPARYLGGEYNLPDMDKPCEERVCLCFADKYEVGMSNIGLRILYHMLNDTEGVVCERSFAPSPDMAEKMREHGIKLFSLETRREFSDFDIVGFSIGFELAYTNVLYMMDLAGVPFYAKDRGEEYPLIIAGGPCMVNPAPIAEFFDAIMVGEGEVNLASFVALHRECKAKGLSKAEFLKRAASLEGVYVPSVGGRVKRAVVKDLDKAYFPTKILVPGCDIVHDRSTLELFRGCANGCRFCQACFYYRPIREKKKETLLRQAKELITNTGYEELSLSSLSTSDYSDLRQLVEGLKEEAEKQNVKLALPSLRLDSFEAEIYEDTKGASLTFAPEAGTQRLRNVINKNVGDEDILSSLTAALERGVKNVKLYFMIGLPTETKEDLKGIVDIVRLVRRIHAEKGRSKIINITVSTAVFIPKPLTPFQWEAQISLDEMYEKQEYLKNELRLKNVKYSWHDAKSSVIEAALARGDGKLCAVLERAYRLGCVFDSWNECFDYDKWTEAFRASGVDPAEYTGAIETGKELAWDFIDNGVTKAYLLKEREKAYRAETTPNCIGKCNGCGATKLGRCFE